MVRLQFNKNQIKKIIPHRDPFLLIDEIIDGNPGKNVTAVKYVTMNDDFFKGHFLHSNVCVDIYPSIICFV